MPSHAHGACFQREWVGMAARQDVGRSYGTVAWMIASGLQALPSAAHEPCKISGPRLCLLRARGLCQNTKVNCWCCSRPKTHAHLCRCPRWFPPLAVSTAATGAHGRPKRAYRFMKCAKGGARAQCKDPLLQVPFDPRPQGCLAFGSAYHLAHAIQPTQYSPDHMQV
jgi:hypothetical protein